jgi:hypothetical protein
MFTTPRDPSGLPFLSIVIDVVQAKYIEVGLRAPGTAGIPIGVHVDAILLEAVQDFIMVSSAVKLSPFAVLRVRGPFMPYIFRIPLAVTWV